MRRFAVDLVFILFLAGAAFFAGRHSIDSSPDSLRSLSASANFGAAINESLTIWDFGSDGPIKIISFNTSSMGVSTFKAQVTTQYCGYTIQQSVSPLMILIGASKTLSTDCHS